MSPNHIRYEKRILKKLLTNHRSQISCVVVSTWHCPLGFSLVQSLGSASPLFHPHTDDLKSCFFDLSITFSSTANPWPDPFHTHCNSRGQHLTATLMWWPSYPEAHLFMEAVTWQPCGFPHRWCKRLTAAPFIFWGNCKAGSGCSTAPTWQHWAHFYCTSLS